jgi:hypothetical protein
MSIGYHYNHCSCNGSKNKLTTKTSPATIPMTQMFDLIDFNMLPINFIILRLSITSLLTTLSWNQAADIIINND